MATATWTADLEFAGLYDISVIYRAGTNRATYVPYTFSTASGEETASVNQQLPNLEWVSFGEYVLSSGPNTVTVDASQSSGGSAVIADAVKFTLLGPPPTPTLTPTPSPTFTPTPTPGPVTMEMIRDHILAVKVLPEEVLDEGDVNRDGLIDVADILSCLDEK